jgi:hypothetical protein
MKGKAAEAGRQDELARERDRESRTPRPRGVRHGVNFRAGKPSDRGGKRRRQHACRLRPRPLAVAEQLGQLFSEAGYAPLTPDWPDDPETVEEARANPEVFAKKTLKQVAAACHPEIVASFV